MIGFGDYADYENDYGDGSIATRQILKNITKLTTTTTTTTKSFPNSSLMEEFNNSSIGYAPSTLVELATSFLSDVLWNSTEQQDEIMLSTTTTTTLTLLPYENTTALNANISDSFVPNISSSVASIISEDNSDVYREIEQIVGIIVPIIFGVIAVTGFFGNSLVILVVLLNRQMQSTTNLLIVNLAIADLCFVIFCVPFTAADYIFDKWPFGDPWCRTVQYFIVVTAFASIYTLVLMSIDRFLAVVHPIRSRELRTEHITKIAIVTLWAIVLTISMPVPFAHGVRHTFDADMNTTYVLCQYLQNDYISHSVYQIAFLASTYLLPLMIISGLYVRMIMRLWRQGSGVRMSVESQRGRKRVTRLVVVVVIAFASLWLPIQLILMLRALNLYYPNTKFKVIAQVVAQTLAYTSSCINPLLYAFLSENFRKAFHKAIHCSNRYQNYSTDLPPPRRTSCARTSTTGL